MTRIGKVYRETGRPGNAEYYFQRALALDPENPYKVNDLARLLVFDRLDLERGLKFIDQAMY